MMSQLIADLPGKTLAGSVLFSIAELTQPTEQLQALFDAKMEHLRNSLIDALRESGIELK